MRLAITEKTPDKLTILQSHIMEAITDHVELSSVIDSVKPRGYSVNAIVNSIMLLREKRYVEIQSKEQMNSYEVEKYQCSFCSKEARYKFVDRFDKQVFGCSHHYHTNSKYNMLGMGKGQLLKRA